ncbi:MAG: hypothetical protein ACOCV2_14050 [Persicimonas sp.]
MTLFMPDEPQTFEVAPAEGYSGDRLTVEVVEPDPLDEVDTARQTLVHSLFESADLDWRGPPAVGLLAQSTLRWVLVIAALLFLLWRSSRMYFGTGRR